MTHSVLLVALAVLVVIAFWVGKSRALSLAGGSSRNLHSLPGYYGLLTALWCAIPALIVMSVWSLGQDAILTHLVTTSMPITLQPVEGGSHDLLLNEIRNVVAGNVPAELARPEVVTAAREYSRSAL